MPPFATGKISETLDVSEQYVVEVDPVPPYAVPNAFTKVSVVNLPVEGVVAPIAGGLDKSSVPPKVKYPEVVTVPVNVNPLTVPVPDTDVTVPSGLEDHWKADPDHSKNVLATVGAAINDVALDPVWYIIWFAVPEAMLVADVAFPLNAAVIVPALKLPETSLATIVETVFRLVASVPKVTAADPLYDVPVKWVPNVKVYGATAVIVVEPPKLTELPLIVIELLAN